jgi:hypothetical protein
VIAEVAGPWEQTLPAPATHADNFDDGQIDAAIWIVAGDGISEAGGVLTMNRDAAVDAIQFRPTIRGAARVRFAIRAIQMQWKDMFHGVRLQGACEAGIDGFRFGFSRYGTFFTSQSSCDHAAFDYPDTFSMDRWYHVALVIPGDGTVSVEVGGEPLATARVPTDGLILTLPGLYSDGGAETNSISELDGFYLELFDSTYTVHVDEGEVIDGLDFGNDS